MTGNCSRNISPDGISGMIFAAEGIKNSITLLNGPMGCRFYHSTTASFLNVQPVLYMTGENGQKIPVDYNWLDKWFFRQQRVPSTALDGFDYVYGTAEKVKEALVFLKDNVNFGIMTIVNSPGASLIGDRLADIAAEVMPEKTTVVLESPGFSSDFARGYEEACLTLVKTLAGKQREAENTGAEAGNLPEKKNRPRVNVLGLSVWDRYFEGDRQEIARILGLAGADVNCFLAAGCTTEEVESLPAADLNIVIDTERALRTAAFMEERFGIPFYACQGLPVGFDAASELAEAVGRICGTSLEAFRTEEEKTRALTWYKINSVAKSGGFPTGIPFAAEAPAARLTGYARFMMEYLGMKPDACAVSGREEPSVRAALVRLFESHHALHCLEKPMEETSAELVFGDANLIASLSTVREDFSGIEISYPGMGYTDVVPKTHLLLAGGMFLTEQILNGLMR
ncbi:MAG: oxidoreductase [Eubacterium sp.]|nr:oxidoreductase [Eubacterium sp.]